MGYSTTYSRSIDAKPVNIFNLLVDFGAIGNLLPDVIESVSVEGSGVGSERTILFYDQEIPIVERLDLVVAPSLISYSIVNDSPLPLDRYHAVVKLDPIGADQCELTYASNWKAKGAPNSEVNSLIGGFYESIVASVVKALDVHN
ncbi:SRPBCC family protein [Pseudonocardia sp. GCM10023141]|uniref:SRPBCC family protein n=1 Tax=Pseudonocardia sp. GCM10023141 TaxID=3252653 RepID=UPI0036185087